eukprot:Rmarinus@m.28108
MNNILNMARSESPSNSVGRMSPQTAALATLYKDMPSHSWVQDEEADNCMNDKCNVPFTMFNRRHHCRECGKIFCNNCSPKRSESFASHPEPSRFCEICYEKLQFVRDHEPILVEGLVLTKHGRKGQPHKRLVRVCREGPDAFVTWTDPQSQIARTESLALSKVRHVVSGIQTDVLRRSGQPNKECVYFSLLADDRTLDLECMTEEERDKLVSAFEQAVKVLPRVCTTDFSEVKAAAAEEDSRLKANEELLAQRRAERQAKKERIAEDLKQKYNLKD